MNSAPATAMINFFKKLPDALVLFILLSSVIVLPFSETIPVYFRHISVSDFKSHPSPKQKQDPRIFEIQDKSSPLKHLHIEATFTLEKLGTYQNIFQTADYNNGVRLEIGPGGDAGLIIRKTDDTFTAFSLPKMEAQKEYHFLLKIEPTRIKIALGNTLLVDDVVSSDPDNSEGKRAISYKVDTIKVGTGFDDERPLIGAIKEFSLRYTVSKNIPVLRKFVLGIIILCLTFFMFRFFRKQEATGNLTQRQHLLAPIFLAAYPVLFHYAHNIKQTSIAIAFADTYAPLAYALLSAGMLLALFFFYTRNLQKAVLFSSLGAFGFFTAGHFNLLANSAITPPLLLILLVSFLIILALILIQNAARIALANKVLLVISSVLLIGVGADIFQTTFFNKSIPEDNSSQIDASNTNAASKATSYRPDIYFIIADGYGHHETLQQEYGFDNSAFISALKKRGFVMPSRVFSNYNKTHLSVPSFLNMDYHPADKIDNAPYLGNVYQNAAAFKFLKKQGYTFFYINPSAAVSQSHNLADVQNKCSVEVTDFTSTLLETTALFAFKLGQSDDGLRALTDCGHATFLDAAKNATTPKFVFYHFFKPHHPYIYTAEGGKVDPAMQLDQKKYIGQLEYTSKKIYELVDSILYGPSKDPIILLVSDHGAYISGYDSEKFFDEKKPDNITPELLFNTPKALGAFYLPRGGDKAIYNGISHVNLFRMVFNYYFKTTFPRLEDKAFLMTATKGHEFGEVTKTLNKIWQDKK